MSGVLAVIPARSGSKGIKDKNLRSVLGHPLLWHSIRHARLAKSIDRVVVSTDSDRYARIAKEAGAEAPFLRPAGISGDASTDLEVFRHALEWFRAHEGWMPDICVHLRPTCPVRNVGDIDRMVELLVQNPAIDSVRSVVEVQHTPFKMWFRESDGSLTPILGTMQEQLFNRPRQGLRTAYLQNACIDVTRTTVIMDKNSMSGSRILGYEMDHLVDIDTIEDLHHVRTLLAKTRRKSRRTRT